MAGETDSGVKPARGCSSSVQRLTTDSAAPTQGFADGLLASAGIGSVGLKNETVIRPTHAFLRSRAWRCRRASGAWHDIGTPVEPGAIGGSVLDS